MWNDKLYNDKAFGHLNGVQTDNGPQGSTDVMDTAGGLFTTAQDYAKFIIALMDTEDKIASRLLKLQTKLPPESDGLYRSLGFPYKNVNGKIRYYHSGNNGDARAYCHFYREDGMGIVMFSNGDNFFSSNFAKNILEYLD